MIRVYFVKNKRGRLVVDARDNVKRIRKATPLYYCSEKAKNEYRRLFYYEFDKEKENTIDAVSIAVDRANDKAMRIIGESFAIPEGQKSK